MPSKRGTATKAKITGRERKFEAERHRAEEKRRRREAERERAEGHAGPVRDALAGEDAPGGR